MIDKTPITKLTALRLTLSFSVLRLIKTNQFVFCGLIVCDLCSVFVFVVGLSTCVGDKDLFTKSMFKKPVRIKSNNPVKGSERKGVKELFLKNFPHIQDTEADALFNNKKHAINCVKVATHNNEVIQVYVIEKQPMLFSLREKIFPTVILLWKYPNLLPAFTTHPQVMSFIASGADLMLPGLVTPPPHSGLSKYGNVSQGTPVYINLSSNKAAVAVGVAHQSSFDMEMAGGKGKCVIVYHFHGDHLCNLESNSIPPIPQLGTLDWLSLKNYDSDFPELGSCHDHNNHSVTTLGDKEIILENIKDDNSSNTTYSLIETIPKTENGVVDMNELLYYCFLASIKYSKTLNLPVLVSNFFKLQMLPMCPSGTILDIKKTTFKKLKVFLDEMCKIGLITVKEIKKGVEAITDINKEHAKFNEFYLKPEDRLKNNPTDIKNKNETTIKESYIVTQNVLPFFQVAGFNKGDIIDGPNIKKNVTNYIKENNCQDLDNTKLIKPNTDVLKAICRTENPISWEELLEKVCASMKNCFEVSTRGDQIVTKGKVSPITMSVSLRSGNKKVTIVDNLEVFGININEFAKECQHGVAASTSITSKPPGKKCDQLLIQGNQIFFVYNLLEEKYKVPKKYIKGLEHAPKKKK